MDNHLLNRTIGCILNQRSKGIEFRIYVVYSDIPENKIESLRVSYIHYPYPFQFYEDIKDGEKYFHLFKEKFFMARFYDKAKKVTYGCKQAKEDGCLYLMNVDADDLISNKILEFVNHNNNNGIIDGWYIPKGYVWENGSRIIIRQKQMQNFNGSTHIIREDIVKIPDFSSSDWLDYNLFASHGWILSRLKQYMGKVLQPISFPAVIYVVHESNDSKIKNSISGKSLKGLAKKILRGQLLTRKLKDEFFIS